MSGEVSEKIRLELADLGLTLSATEDGGATLLSREYEQTFHSSAGAKVEAQRLYLEAAGLRERILEDPKKPQNETVAVLDIGLGLAVNGLNFLEYWLSTPNVSRSVELYSLEKNPHLIDLISRPEISSAWMSEWSHASVLFTQNLCQTDDLFWRINHPIHSDLYFTWKIFLADALDSIQKFDSKVDCFWQDAFSPSANPELWSQDWFARLSQLAKTNATLVTYSVSGLVKRNLKNAGWQIEKFRSGTKKREWLRARRVDGTT